jgi:hypothetical protein
MTIEERVREALRADAQRLELPPTPPLERLRAGRSRPLAGRLVVAGASLAGVVALLAVVLWLPSELPSPDVDSIAASVPPDPSAPHGLSFDPDGGEVFAEGEAARDVVWRAAASHEGQLEHVDFGRLCVGIALEQGSLDVGQRGSCEAEPDGLVIAHHEGQGEVVAAVGAVPDEVLRVVWELPDGERELELHEQPGVPQRLFAAAASGIAGQPSRVVGYDADGHELFTRTVPSVVLRQAEATPRYHLIATERDEEHRLRATLVVGDEPTIDDLRAIATTVVGELRRQVDYTALGVEVTDSTRLADLGVVYDMPGLEQVPEDFLPDDADPTQAWGWHAPFVLDLGPGDYDGFETLLLLRQPHRQPNVDRGDIETTRGVDAFIRQGFHAAEQPDASDQERIRSQAIAQVADDSDLSTNEVEQRIERVSQWQRIEREAAFLCHADNPHPDQFECSPLDERR